MEEDLQVGVGHVRIEHELAHAQELGFLEDGERARDDRVARQREGDVAGCVRVWLLGRGGKRYGEEGDCECESGASGQERVPPH